MSSTLPAALAGTSLREAPGTGPLLPVLGAGVAIALTVCAAAALQRAGIALRTARAGAA
ncbi:MAG: hypothetical protein Q4E05_05960 [Pseudoclavibacter sp.]|nr:hypothetical protein [Pseudoclavibacter sp.]